MTESMSKRPIVVVTGGTAGVGRATVREFASAGYDVAVLARGRAGLEGAANSVETVGGRCLPISVDVADETALEAATDRVEAELGPIDVWVNVAFAGSLAFFWDTTPEEYRRMTEVTYFGQVNGTRAALRVMRARDRGSIVNVSSAMAYRSIPLQSAYCGAKHATKGFTESLITELRATKSRVTIGLVTLPGVNTTQFNWNLTKMPKHPMPVPPIVQPEVCARAIRFSAEHARRNMWVGSRPRTPCSATASHPRSSTGTWVRPACSPSRPTRTRRAGARTCSNPKTTSTIVEREGRSQPRPPSMIRCPSSRRIVWRHSAWPAPAWEWPRRRSPDACPGDNARRT